MYAVILRPSDRPETALLRIAGRPLIARQIQWLRTIGCGAIAVEIDPSPEGADVARWLTEEDAIGAVVSLVLAGRAALSPREIARRTGFPDGVPLLVIPADVVAGGALGAWLERAAGGSAIMKLKPPRALEGRLEGADIYVASATSEAPITIEPEGWAVRVRSRADAMELGAAVIDGRLCSRPDDPSWGIQVHAPEISKGIWIGRGAAIGPGAELVAPVLVGAGAVVCSGARLGPRVCLGERAVVEAGTSIRDAVVSAGTIVGERLNLAEVVVEPYGLVDPVTGELREVDDSLALAARDRRPKACLFTRVMALSLLVALSPVGLLWLFWSRLGRAPERRATVLLDPRCVVLTDDAAGPLSRVVEVIRGTRALVGLSPWAGPFPDDISDALYRDALSAPLGIFAVDAALTPLDDEPAARLRARAWYAHAKCLRLDAALLLRCLWAPQRRRLAGRRAASAAEALSASRDRRRSPSLPRDDRASPG